MFTTESLKEELSYWLEPLTQLDRDYIKKLFEIPPSLDLGDLAFPCYNLAKSWRRAPQQIAAELSQQLQADYGQQITGSASGAYLNISWNRAYYAPLLLESIAAEDYSQLQLGKGQKVIIDMSSPNIAKPFGVGHLRSTVIGAALYRMYCAAGYEAVRVNHIGDWGTQFGKQITAHLRWSDPVQAAADPIGEALRVYILFHEQAVKHPELEDEARSWFRRLEQADTEAVELWKYFVHVSMESLEKIYERLGVEFDEVLGESFYNDKMPAVVQQLKKLQLLEDSDGAQVVRLDEQDMPPCLILKSDGTTIYPTRDLATAIYRKQVMRGDQLVYVVGGEQTLHFRQVFAVLGKMGYECSDACTHIPFGLMKINGKKMSTRKGQVIFLEEVLDAAVAQAEHIIEQKNPQLQDKRKTAEQVGIGAIIFNDLKNHRQNEIDFSLEEAVSFEGETGPYVQYAYTRTQSVLRRAEVQQLGIVSSVKSESHFMDWSDAAWELVCHLGSYRSELARAVHTHAPSILARYALQTARLFNQWYSRERILDGEPNQINQRLELTRQTGAYLQRLLHLLGMQAPRRM